MNLTNESYEKLAEKIKIVAEDTGTTSSIILEDFLKKILDKDLCYLPFIEALEEHTQVNGIAILKEKKITYLEKETVDTKHFHTTSSQHVY